MIYLYRCPRCGEIELEHRMTDPPVKKCPLPVAHENDVCGRPLERLIAGGTNFVLKGSGWAKDGYR